MIVDCSCTSEMSWFSLVTTSCWRVESIEKPRSSGCVYCADQFGLNDGLNSAVALVVVVRVLFSATLRLPPPHGMFCVSAAVVGLQTLRDAAARRHCRRSSTSTGSSSLCVASCEVSDGR